jgi:hypothetical protein
VCLRKLRQRDHEIQGEPCNIASFRVLLNLGQQVQGQRFFISSEKEFKDGHTRDLSRIRFINIKQSVKVCQMGGQVSSRRSYCSDSGPETKSFYWGLLTWGSSFLENWVCVINYSHKWSGEFWSWMVKVGLFCGYWVKTRPCCMSWVFPLISTGQEVLHHQVPKFLPNLYIQASLGYIARHYLQK